MNFYRSLYDLASVLPSEKARQRLLVAMLDYFFEGKEPEGLGRKESAAFEAVRGRIECSRTNSDNRKGRKSKGESDGGGESVARFVANETRNETANETDYGSADETCETETRIDGDRLLSPSHKGFKNIRDEVDSQGFEPPTLEEVSAYFGCNALKGDPRDFWENYESQGWVKGNGQPVTNWKALAQKWSRSQVQRDHDRAERDRKGSWREQPQASVPKPVNAPDETLDADIEAYRAKWGEDPC